MHLMTARLLIDELRDDDVEALWELFGDPLTLERWPRPLTRVEVNELLERQLCGYRERGFGLWAVRSRATGELLGDCGLIARTIDASEETEIAWHLLRRHWHQGYATEAARAIVRLAFETLGKHRLVALILPSNEASIRIAERLGMSLEKETMHAGLRHLVYAIESRADRGPATAAS